jgi:nitroreductase
MTNEHVESRHKFLEFLGTARATRWFLDDDVPEEMLTDLLWAATRASSAHNSQPWDFVVVRDEMMRRKIGDSISRAVQERDPMPPAESKADVLIDAGVRNLFEHLADVPVLLFVCASDNYPPSAPLSKFMWSAISSAAQNIVVAARAMGLGTAPTMLHTLNEPEIRALLGMPLDRTIGVTCPVGWPARPFGAMTRKALDDVVHYDGWGGSA